MAVLLGQLDEGRAQRLGRLRHEFLKVDHCIGIDVAAAEDLLNLFVLDKREAERLQGGFHFLAVERAVPVRVRGLERAAQRLAPADALVGFRQMVSITGTASERGFRGGPVTLQIIGAPVRASR